MKNKVAVANNQIEKARVSNIYSSLKVKKELLLIIIK